ncbi:MAG: hypothetical protein GIX01_10055 [Candidatus Eremiobacteraeota bacterium]|nr:hypothetical protein [Candidatus Eremiobacteraeota bacterium]
MLAFGLAACSHGTTSSEVTATPGPDNGKVGYVNMDALVKVHPLYPQLAHLDDDVAALELRSVGPQIARSGADIARQEAQLQRELDEAADRTKRALGDKQQEYAKQEQAAIAAALGAAGSQNGSGSIAASVAAQARVQAQRVTAASQANVDTYRRQLVDQERTAAATLDRALGERAAREYRARADELARKESDYALSLASADAAERLSLRTKLSNLALDDATRAEVTKALAALDRKEADAVGAMRNRDQATLAAFQVTLHARVRRELAQQIGSLQKRTVAKINVRQQQAQSQIVGQVGLPPTGGVAVPPGVGPGMRQKLETLHARFQHDFDRDASQTVAQFQRTRAELTRRFHALAGADAADRSGAERQIDALQKQRGDLYGEMVAQINREVKVIAQKRGIGVVVSNVVAPAGGVDLTSEAQKDIESLHE